MKNFPIFFLATILLFSATGCTSTFMGTVLVLTFKDLILYVFMAFVLAVLLTIFNSGKRNNIFWLWFVLNLILTPLAGFIYLIVIFSKNVD